MVSLLDRPVLFAFVVSSVLWFFLIEGLLYVADFITATYPGIT